MNMSHFPDFLNTFFCRVRGFNNLMVEKSVGCASVATGLLGHALPLSCGAGGGYK